MNSSDIHALSGAYAVDALDDLERAHFERHLAECAVCSAEVESLQEAASLLAETTITAPSPALRARVLAEIANVRVLPPEVGADRIASESPAHRADVAVDSGDAGTATVTELAPRRRRRLTTFLAAAAAVVAIGAGGAVLHQVSQDDAPQDQYSQISAASDVQRFSVPVGDGGSATVVRSKKLNEAAIVTKGMPAAPTGRQYVLWLRHGNTMTNAGVIPAGADNTVVFSGDAASADGAAVSIEQSGQATTPSDDIAAAFSFDA